MSTLGSWPMAGGGSDCQGPQSTLWAMKQSCHLPTPRLLAPLGHWGLSRSDPRVVEGEQGTVLPALDRSRSPQAVGQGCSPETGTLAARPRCWFSTHALQGHFLFLPKSLPALEDLTRPQADAWIN